MADFDPAAFLAANSAPPQPLAHPNAAPVGSTGGAFDPAAFIAANSASHPPAAKAPPGSSPDSPLNEGGLSIVDRALFGWARSPKAQTEMLTKTFGKDNVKVQPGGQFVVKNEDGQWRLADPTGWSDAPGEVAQWLGDKGFLSAGAMAGGIQGAAIGTGFSPILGTAAGALIGGAIGGLGGKSAELGVKAATGGDTPHNINDLTSQLGASMAFGAEQEGLGFLGGKVLGGGAKALGYVLNRIGRSETGIAARTALVQAMGGMAQPLARAWAESPLQTAVYQDIAKTDLEQGTNTLWKKMTGALGDFADEAHGALQKVGSQYSDIAKEVAGKGLDLSGKVDDAFNQLVEGRYIDAGGKVIEHTADVGGKLREGVDANVVKKLVADKSVIEAAQASGKKLTYNQIRDMISNMNVIQGTQGVSDGNLQRIAALVKNSLDESLGNGLDAVRPGLGAEYNALNKKYSTVVDFVNDLRASTEPNRVNTFLNQITKDNGAYSPQILRVLSEDLGLQNPTDQILQMAAAQDSAKLFVNRGAIRAGGYTVPRSPKMAAGLMKGEMAVRNEVSGFAGSVDDKVLGGKALPYMTEVVNSFKGASQDVRKMALENPGTIQGIRDLISGAMMKEQQDTQSLVQPVVPPPQ